MVSTTKNTSTMPCTTANTGPDGGAGGTVFAVVQGIVLVFFVVLTIGAWRRFKPMAFA